MEMLISLSDTEHHGCTTSMHKTTHNKGTLAAPSYRARNGDFGLDRLFNGAWRFRFWVDLSDVHALGRS